MAIVSYCPISYHQHAHSLRQPVIRIVPERVERSVVSQPGSSDRLQSPDHYFDIQVVVSNLFGSLMTDTFSITQLARRPTRREVFLLGCPQALPNAHHQLQQAPLHKELMRDPALGPRLPIQGRPLNVLGLIGRIEIQHANDRPLAVPRPQLDLTEKGRRQQIHILTRHGEESHHGKRREGAHSAVVVAGDARPRGVEQARNVLVGPVRAETGPSCVMELEDGEERLLVAHVDDARLVEVLKALRKQLLTAHGLDQRGHVLRHVEGVQPWTAFICTPVRVEVAPVHLVHGAAEPRVVVREGAIEQAGLQEAFKVAPHELFFSSNENILLGGIPQVAPVLAALHVLAVIGVFS